MRGFWHTIALIAENAGTFNKGLFAVCKSVNDPDLLKSVNLTSNPSDKRKLQLKKTTNSKHSSCPRQASA